MLKLPKTKPSPSAGRLTVLAKSLAAYDNAGKPPGYLTRANKLLTTILGDDAGLATLVDTERAGDGSMPDGTLIAYVIDEMKLYFISGGTPEDDFFLLELFGMRAGEAVAIRSLAGLGYAVSAYLAQIRELFEDVRSISVHKISV